MHHTIQPQALRDLHFLFFRSLPACLSLEGFALVNPDGDAQVQREKLCYTHLEEVCAVMGKLNLEDVIYCNYMGR
jgi:hypothetical protein